MNAFAFSYNLYCTQKRFSATEAKNMSTYQAGVVNYTAPRILFIGMCKKTNSIAAEIDKTTLYALGLCF